MDMWSKNSRVNSIEKYSNSYVKVLLGVKQALEPPKNRKDKTTAPWRSTFSYAQIFATTADSGIILAVLRHQQAQQQDRPGDIAMPPPLRRRRCVKEAASPRRHITCTHHHCVDAARRPPLAARPLPHRLHTRSKSLGPPRLGRGAAYRIAKTSPPQIRN